MTYTVFIQKSAQKSLDRISSGQQDRIIAAIRSLSHDPRPLGTKKLSGRDAWRVRIGDYRVIYEFYDERLIVLIVAVGHRKEISR